MACQVSRRHVRSFGGQEARIIEWISVGKEVKRGNVEAVGEPILLQFESL